MKKIILASSSKNRQIILKSLNIPFQAVAANLNEKQIKEENPNRRARKLAKLKGQAVAKNHKAIIIAADTFTFCDGKIIQKNLSGRN